MDLHLQARGLWHLPGGHSSCPWGPCEIANQRDSQSWRPSGPSRLSQTLQPCGPSRPCRTSCPGGPSRPSCARCSISVRHPSKALRAEGAPRLGGPLIQRVCWYVLLISPFGFRSIAQSAHTPALDGKRDESRSIPLQSVELCVAHTIYIVFTDE